MIFMFKLKLKLNFLQALINFIITANSRMVRTSTKFLQWSDLRTNIIYGLGFEEELELCKVTVSDFTALT